MEERVKQKLEEVYLDEAGNLVRVGEGMHGPVGCVDLTTGVVFVYKPSTRANGSTDIQVPAPGECDHLRKEFGFVS
jgi:hypothetical protein